MPLARARELAGRALMWLAVPGAAGTALLAVLDADGATKVVETWRMYGLVVFTGLFVLLMLRSHHYRGVWELVIASKLAMTFTAVSYASMLATRRGSAEHGEHHRAEQHRADTWLAVSSWRGTQKLVRRWRRPETVPAGPGGGT